MFYETRCFCHFPAQPAGVPEILKKSLHSCSVRGGEEVFIIGKNFLKGTKVIFQENIAGAVVSSVWSEFYRTLGFCLQICVVSFVDDNSWQAEAKIDMDLFHQVFSAV